MILMNQYNKTLSNDFISNYIYIYIYIAFSALFPGYIYRSGERLLIHTFYLSPRDTCSGITTIV